MIINDFYNTLKPKQVEKIRLSTYFDLLFQIINNMFIWEGLPKSIPQRFLEGYMHIFGSVGVAKINNELVCGVSSYCGQIDAYGIGTSGIVTTPTGTKEGKINEEVCICWNNDLMQKDKLLYEIIHFISEIDKSIDCNILFARFIPIPIANDKPQKVAYDEAIKNIQEGKVDTIVSANILLEELGIDHKTLDLTDVNQADKIQYLSKLFDDILKRFFIFYGHNLQTINQGSQTNNDELHGYDSISRLIPEIMLKCRRDFCEELNSTFGLNVSVRFNESIQNNIDEDDAQTELTEAEVEKTQSEATEPVNPVDTDNNDSQPSNNVDNPDNPDNEEDEEKESPEKEEKIGDEEKEEKEEEEKKEGEK